MSLIAIAKIHDNGKQGFRFLDKHTGEVKDIDLASTKRILEDFIVEIDNLGLKGDKIIGTKSKIECISTIEDGKLRGLPYLVLLDRDKDKDILVVTNYTGKIMTMTTIEAVEYMNIYGASNCKSSRIKGKYVVSFKQGTADGTKLNMKMPKNNGEYLGEKMSIPVIDKIVVGDHNCNRNILNKAFRYKDGAIEILYLHGIKGSHIGKDFVNIYGDEYKTIGTNYYINNKDIEEKLIRHVRIEPSSVLEINNKRDRAVCVTLDMNRLENKCDDEVKGIMYSIKKNKIDLIVMVIKEDNKGYVALARECSKDGIEYQVLVDRNVIMKISIENIFKSIDNYDNVEKISDKEFIIKGIDGVYRYNIDKINESYKNNIVESRKALKAKVLNSDYTENINAKGELIKLRSGVGDILKVPDTVSVIKRGSIVITNNINELIIGESVIKSYQDALSLNSSIGTINLKVIIRNKKCLSSLIKDITREGSFVEYGRIKIIVEGRDITYKEYANYLIYNFGSRRTILKGNITRNNIIKAYEYFIKAYKKGSVLKDNILVSLKHDYARGVIDIEGFNYIRDILNK